MTVHYFGTPPKITLSPVNFRSTPQKKSTAHQQHSYPTRETILSLLLNHKPAMSRRRAHMQEPVFKRYVEFFTKNLYQSLLVMEGHHVKVGLRRVKQVSREDELPAAQVIDDIGREQAGIIRLVFRTYAYDTPRRNLKKALGKELLDRRGLVLRRAEPHKRRKLRHALVGAFVNELPSAVR